MTTKTTGSFLDNSSPPVDAQYLNIQREEMNNLIGIDGSSIDGTGSINNQWANSVKSYVSQAGILCTDTSSGANVYVVNASTPFTNPVLKTGTRIRFKTANANTGSSTIAAFGGSAVTCKKSDGSTNLVANDIPANSEVEFVYNGTNWVKTSYGLATTTNQGVIEIATNAETVAGTDTERAIVPSALASLFGASSRSANGYARLPVKVGSAFVEIIIQWGTSGSIGADSTLLVTLPLTFPTAIASVVATGSARQIFGAGNANSIQAEKTSTSQITLASSGYSQSANWIAIGY